MTPSIFLSVIIPAYNEENRLRQALPPVRDYLQGQDFSWEVIVVDDGSSDNTSKVLEEIFPRGEARVLRNPGNRGKGYSVRQGVFAARGEILLFSDADFSTPIEEFGNLHSYLRDNFDIAIGSRALKESKLVVHQPWLRERIGRMFILFVRMIALKGFHDTQCGFKCFRRDAALKVFSKATVDGFSFDVELLLIAQRRGLRIKEVPVEWRDAKGSKVNVVKDSIRMLVDLCKIRVNFIRGVYD